MIKSTTRYVMRSLGAVLVGMALAGAPALTYAQHGGGGGGGGGHGGGGGGGGGHFGGGFGGGHFGGGFGGGGHGFGGGGFHFGGYGHAYGGGHAFAAPHYGVTGHSYGGYGGRYFASSGRGFAYAGPHSAYAAHSGYVAHPGAVAPHPGVGAPSATYYWHGGHAWAGGYWHGGYWPHCWYYPGWAWYLPVLPVGYATYWWGGVPYYYWNSLYYTWSPAQSGYVVTDPPPVEGVEGSSDGSGGYEQAPESSYAPQSSGSAGDVYVYPRNGQTQQQTDNDRYECHSWAVSQSGFDPTRPQQAGNPDDYRRAMVACLDARGYSAR